MFNIPNNPSVVKAFRWVHRQRPQLSFRRAGVLVWVVPTPGRGRLDVGSFVSGFHGSTVTVEARHELTSSKTSLSLRFRGRDPTSDGHDLSFPPPKRGRCVAFFRKEKQLPTSLFFLPLSGATGAFRLSPYNPRKTSPCPNGHGHFTNTQTAVRVFVSQRLANARLRFICPLTSFEGFHF